MILLALGGRRRYNEPMQSLALLSSPTQWMILVVICLVIFGAKRLPEIARSLGKSLGEFKKARREFEDELMKADPMAETKPAPKSIEAAVEVEVKPVPEAEKQAADK